MSINESITIKEAIVLNSLLGRCIIAELSASDLVKLKRFVSNKFSELPACDYMRVFRFQHASRSGTFNNLIKCQGTVIHRCRELFMHIVVCIRSIYKVVQLFTVLLTVYLLIIWPLYFTLTLCTHDMNILYNRRCIIHALFHRNACVFHTIKFNYVIW